jgi:hypothetical protein
MFSNCDRIGEVCREGKNSSPHVTQSMSNDDDDDDDGKVKRIRYFRLCISQ